MPDERLGPLPVSALPNGVRARILERVNGLDMHVLEAGYDRGVRPAILLLHGFPELAYCWRRVMPMLAEQGYYVIAPDQRGYGRTSPDPVSYHDSIDDYNVLNLVTDMVSLIKALGLDGVDAVVGHDFGAIVAGASALIRPDLFQRLVLLSTPFNGAPPAVGKSFVPFCDDPIHAELASLSPARKHYQLYYSEAVANRDMWHCPQGVREFLRGYYYQKSADWPGNDPRPLKAWSATEMAQMPSYYCMPAELNMAEIAQASLPSRSLSDACQWLTESDLDIVSGEFDRTGFQGGLQWYRSTVSGATRRSLSIFSGRKIGVPTVFISGRADWGTFQVPGALEIVRQGLATQEVPVHILDGAGHWLQQEQPEAVCQVLLDFFRDDTRKTDVPGNLEPQL